MLFQDKEYSVLGCADNRTAYKKALENGFDCNGISFNMAAETMTNSNAVFLATKIRLLFLGWS